MLPDPGSFDEDPTRHDPFETADADTAETADDFLADDLTLPADSDIVAQIRAARPQPLRQQAGPHTPVPKPVPHRRSTTTERVPTLGSTAMPAAGDVPSLIDRTVPGDDSEGGSLWDPQPTAPRQTKPATSLKAVSSRHRVWLGLVLVAALLSAVIVAAAIWFARGRLFV